jgi:hypothetical protein
VRKIDAIDGLKILEMASMVVIKARNGWEEENLV